jgi:hypothetical protein
MIFTQNGNMIKILSPGMDFAKSGLTRYRRLVDGAERSCYLAELKADGGLPEIIAASDVAGYPKHLVTQG